MSEILRGNEGIKIEGHKGTWYVINEKTTERHGSIYLLEHETYGDEAPCLIIDSQKNIIIDDVWNGFRDYEETFAVNKHFDR